jgi:DNA invertase Pin-like site-specific DNA recombinase
MTSALSYIRVSTKRQMNDGISISEQVKSIIAYAKRNGLSIIRYIQEAISGTKITSLTGDQLQGIKHIIIADVSRFSRNVNIGTALIKKITSRGIKVHFIYNDLVITKSSVQNKDCDFMRFIKELELAELESKKIGERISRIYKYKKSRNEYAGGKVPYGLQLYDVDYINENGVQKTVKKFEFNEHEINVIKFIEECRSDNFTEQSLTDLMQKISQYTEPIELDDENYEDHFDFGKLSYKNIANLLNEYEVASKTKFTVCRLLNMKSIKDLTQLTLTTPETNYAPPGTMYAPPGTMYAPPGTMYAPSGTMYENIMDLCMNVFKELILA